MNKMASLKNKDFHLFNPRLTKPYAKKLLNHILSGTQKDKDIIIIAAKQSPASFFIQTTTHAYGMDLEKNRALMSNWSPYQALFLDPDMLAAVKPDLDNYLNQLKNGHQLAENQVSEKFPHGLEFPDSTYDFNPLVTAINNDKDLAQTGQPNTTTLAALEQFKRDFKPGIISTGHPFNMNDFVRALQIYDANYYQHWHSNNQVRFFNHCVIGFLERLMTRFYLMTINQGLYPLSHNETFTRKLRVMDYLHNVGEALDKNGNRNTLEVIPLDRDLTSRLGEQSGFVINCYYGIAGSFWDQYVATQACKEMLHKHTVELNTYTTYTAKHQSRAYV